MVKISQSIIRDQLMEHLLSTDQLSPDQHSFRQKRSCMTQLLDVIEDWTKALEDGDPVEVVYLDFQNPFDSVPHNRLLSKLRARGVYGQWSCSRLDPRFLVQSPPTSVHQRLSVTLGPSDEWRPSGVRVRPTSFPCLC